MSIEPTTVSTAAEIGSSAEERTAGINFDQEGNPLGVSLFLCSEELEALGVDLETDRISYRVKDGEIEIET